MQKKRKAKNKAITDSQEKYLKKNVSKFTAVEMAKKFGINLNTMRHIAWKEGLKFKKKAYPKNRKPLFSNFDKEFITTNALKYSRSEFAQIFNVSYDQFNSFIKYHGIIVKAGSKDDKVNARDMKINRETEKSSTIDRASFTTYSNTNFSQKYSL